MPSAAMKWWRSDAQRVLDGMVGLHRLVSRHGPGRRQATEQVNNAYTVLLSSQFQKFCRDLHSISADRIVDLTPVSIRILVHARFTEGRKLDTGNPNPGNIGNDFNRFGLKFWDEIRAADPRNIKRQEKLQQLNLWRNAIGHHDFSDAALSGRVAVRLHEVEGWRRACDGLAAQFDNILLQYLTKVSGKAPW